MASQDQKNNTHTGDPAPVEIDIDADAPNYDINNDEDFEDLFGEADLICLHPNPKYKVFNFGSYWYCPDCKQEIDPPDAGSGFESDPHF